MTAELTAGGDHGPLYYLHGSMRRCRVLMLFLDPVALVAQQRPIVVKLSRERSVGRSVCLSSALWNKSSSGDEIPERDVTYHLIWLLIYHWTTHICSTPDNFWSNAYISNGRRFTKSALRILLLSTFRVSSINYSLVCSLPIHTRSPTKVEGPRAHCQSKSCKML